MAGAAFEILMVASRYAILFIIGDICQMHKNKENEEYLEILWCMKEENEDALDRLKNTVGDDFDADVLNVLAQQGQVVITDDGTKISLTEPGTDYARKIIRAHRIAEKLICDALGSNFESAACEFEHIINTDLVDSICTLLGHPRFCPHGKPIPQGQCCQAAAKTVQSTVMSLTELMPGALGRVAYINYTDDMQLHKLDTLKIMPGEEIKLLQKSPSYVVSCAGGDVAMDHKVAENILLWKQGGQFKACGEKTCKTGKCRKRRGFRFLRALNG